MKKNKNQGFEIDNRLQLLSIFLLLVVAIPAIRIGWNFLNDPSGESAGFTLDQLVDVPFESYLLPGIVLFFVFGILSILAATFVFFEVEYYPWTVIGQGVLLILWLGGEVLFGFSLADLQYPFFVLGFFLLLLGGLMRFKQKKLKRSLRNQMSNHNLTIP